ncbi:MAG: hypothetical protein L6302_00635 [Desulfobacteraceae bacterium]|nr:hypothetical protein [Desulfobacteraceae bacterium]
MAKKINIKIKRIATDNLVLDKRKQKGSPTMDPNVPGAKGMYPAKQPVASTMTDFSLKVMHRFYKQAKLLSSCLDCSGFFNYRVIYGF